MATAAEKTTRAGLLIVMLAAAWLLWSGLFKPLLIGLGAVSCLLVLYLSSRMNYFDNETFAIRIGLRLLKYWIWLAKEVVKSSIDVARIVLNPRMPISPKVVDVKATASHPVYHVILANSITLTPGTLSLDVHKGIIKVHALTEAGADDLMSGEMDRRVAALRDE